MWNNVSIILLKLWIILYKLRIYLSIIIMSIIYIRFNLSIYLVLIALVSFLFMSVKTRQRSAHCITNGYYFQHPPCLTQFWVKKMWQNNRTSLLAGSSFLLSSRPQLGKEIMNVGTLLLALNLLKHRVKLSMDKSSTNSKWTALVTLNNWFMRQRAYVEILSTWEVWTARKRHKSCTRRSQMQL